MLKGSDNGLYADNYKNAQSYVADKNISFTMGLGKLDSLAKNAYQLALDGKITVYDPFNVEIRGTDVRFLTILSRTEIYNYFNSSDTTQIQYPYPPYDTKDTVFTKTFNPSDVVAIDFYETWTINSKTMGIKKKIIAICPVIAVYGWDKEYRGLLPMFWIKM